MRRRRAAGGADIASDGEPGGWADSHTSLGGRPASAHPKPCVPQSRVSTPSHRVRCAGRQQPSTPHFASSGLPVGGISGDPKNSARTADSSAAGHRSGPADPTTASAGVSIAVGTPVARRPPRRSQRALLTHWAPPLGESVEAGVRPGMRDLKKRQPPVSQAPHPLPGQSRALAATPKRHEPVPHRL